MIKKFRIRHLLIALSIPALLLLLLNARGSVAVQAHTSHPSPSINCTFSTLCSQKYNLFITIIGEKQGQFNGENPQGTIPATDFVFPLSQVSGKLQGGPITITKVVDDASPQILQAMVTNETLTKVVFQFVTTTDGVVHHTITLEGAHIVSFKQYLPQQNGPEFEDLAFDYTKLKYQQGTSEVCIDLTGANSC